MKCPTCQADLTQTGKFWVCPEHGLIPAEATPSPASGIAPAQKVFISYGRQDAMEFAKRLAADLQKYGHTVFLDIDSIQKGGLYEVRIEQGIRSASVLAAVMTPYSLRENSVCRDEIVFALNEGKNVLPLKADADPTLRPSLLLARRNWIDFSASYDEGLSALLRFLKGDESALIQPALPTITGVAPIDFGPEIARFTADFTGREWVNGEIDRWLSDDTRRAMVIVAEPGVGKSAIAAWLSQTREDVVGIHFCTQQNSRTRDPHEFVANLVSQLHARLPGFAEAVGARYPQRRRSVAADAFRELIVEVTRALPAPSRAQLIVVDSLDEAMDQTGETVVDVLVQQAPDLPAWLRILATTRPEEPILQRIRTLNVFELMAERAENRADVRSYLDRRLATPSLKQRLGDESGDAAAQLEALSEGNFLYARMALDALEDGSIRSSDLHHLAPGLTRFFFETFRRRFPDMESFERVYAPLLRALTAARGPLPFPLLCRLGEGEAEAVRRHLHELHSYLRIYGRGESATYAIYHRSLKDWLTNADAAGSYWCRAERGDKALAALGWQIYEGGRLWSDDYFFRYLPDHLVGAEEWKNLSELLTDLSLLDIIYTKQRNHEWMRLWLKLMEIQQPAEAYRRALDNAKGQGVSEESIALSAERVGWLLRWLGLFPDAVKFAQEAVAAREKATTNPLEDVKLAGSLRNLAEAWRELKEFEQALPCYERALAIWRQKCGEQSAEVGTISHDLAFFYRDQKNYPEAIASNNRALAIREKLVPRDLAALAECVNNTAVLLVESGKGQDALKYYEQALDLFRQAYPTGEQQDIAAVLGNIANVHNAQGDHKRALPLFQRAMEMALAFRVFHHPQCRIIRGELVSCYQSLGMYADAAHVQRESVRCADVLWPPGAGERLVERARLAELLEKAGELAEAKIIRIEIFHELKSVTESASELAMSDAHVDPGYLRQLALTCFQGGDYFHTEEILRFLLAKGFEVPSTHCHLARVLILLNRETEAREEIVHAWESREKAQPYVLRRILFFQFLLALLDGRDGKDPEKRKEIAQRITEIKAALQDESGHIDWTMQPVLDYLQPRLTPDAHTFLTVLLSVLCDRQHLHELDDFAVWWESSTP
jgi:tetratricopeptide (TPR) repeat protein